MTSAGHLQYPVSHVVVETPAQNGSAATTSKGVFPRMKRTVLMTILAVSGAMVLAQGAGAGVSAAGGATAAAVVPSVNASAMTNAVSGKPDLSRIQAIDAELRAIIKVLRPEQEKLLQANDPELKALTEKAVAAQQLVSDLEEQRREWIDKQLSANPKLAPFVEKRRELLRTLNAMRSSASAAGAGHELGYGSRRGALRENLEPARPEAVPKAIPAPVSVPGAEQSAGQAK